MTPLHWRIHWYKSATISEGINGTKIGQAMLFARKFVSRKVIQLRMNKSDGIGLDILIYDKDSRPTVLFSWSGTVSKFLELF